MCNILHIGLGEIVLKPVSYDAMAYMSASRNFYELKDYVAKKRKGSHKLRKSSTCANIA